MRVDIDSRVFARHPELTRVDVEHAVRNAVRTQARLGAQPASYLGIGPDAAGRLLEWVGFPVGSSAWYVYHAMAATKKALRELGWIR